MGKNSLIKSTSKKKQTKKEAEEKVEKKKTVKAKTASKPKTKSTKAKTTKAKTGKTTKKTKAKKITYKDLIFKKFDAYPPENLFVSPDNEEKPAGYTAPPSITGEAAEVQRIKKLLFNKYDYTSVKAAAEKAAAEKAAAEKAAAEKAAAEKAAAEKAAAEKAAAEKAAAEKAAAEKAAAEKAAAEKAAAEKAAAERIKPTPPLKRIEPEQKVSVSYLSGKKKKPMDPQSMTMKLAIAFFALLVLSALGASFSNSGTYTLLNKNGSVEVWKGKFAPLGKKMVLSLPGIEVSDEIKTKGSEKIIFPFVVNYFLTKADGFLDEPGTPDFIEIQSYLEKALPFAVTPALKNDVNLRMGTIQFMSLLYRAEVSANDKTQEGIEKALALLEEAKGLAIDDAQTALVDQKINDMNMQLAPVEQTTSRDLNETTSEVAPAPTH